MAKIGLIDNDMITRQTHNFPNLAIMKLSAWHKKQGYDVKLINFDMINPMNMFTEHFDTVYVSKVFSDTYTPDFINNLDFVKKGGSGFFYDLAERLPNEIEHIKPDYDLYKNEGEYYKDFSIGFITRGCIRQCSFCINRNYKKVDFASKPIEFIDENRPFVMLLDDNITAYKDFEQVFNELNEIGKPFVFKQGMDFRLLTAKKMDILWNSNYYSACGSKSKGDRVFHFAFDNINDSKIIEEKLKYYFFNKPYKFCIMFYVLTGFDRSNTYNIEFFKKDFGDLLIRIKLLLKYNAKPYVMIHEDYKKSPYSERINEIKNIFNSPRNYGEGFEKACIRFKKHKLLNLIKSDYPFFMDLHIENRLYKNIAESERSLYWANGGGYEALPIKM